jgi:acetyl esterase
MRKFSPDQSPASILRNSANFFTRSDMTAPADRHQRWLDPEIRAFIARSDSFFPPEENAGGIARTRAMYLRMCDGFRAPRPAGVVVSDGTVPALGREIPVRRYRPAQPVGACLLYAHGGGFLLGNLESHDDVCAELCAGARVEVVSVDYRLAPEHVYPAALDDVEAAYRVLATEKRPVVVGGDSAGARLAATLCVRLRRLGQKQPAGQVLIYPGLSSDPLRVAGSRAATAPGLSAEDCVHYNRAYAGGDLPQGDPEFAPLDATDFSGLAPAAVFAAGYDPLRQDAEDFAALLHAAGVPVRYRDDPGLIHGWLRARHGSGLAGRAFAVIIAAVAALAAGTMPD